MKLELWWVEFPPYMVRLLARKRSSKERKVPISGSEIASGSGISLRRVDEISRMKSWDNLRVGEASAFIVACGMSVRSLFRDREYIKKSVAGRTDTMFAHIDSLPDAEKALLNKIMHENSREIALYVRSILGIKGEPD